jgi:hypothetical protein
MSTSNTLRRRGRRSVSVTTPVRRVTSFLAFLLFATSAVAQDPQFSVEEYSAFLDTHLEVSAEDLLGMHPAGVFDREINGSFDRALFAPTVDSYYHLTDYEKSILRRQGFVVTERLQPNSFGEAFVQIYDWDLPVFISTDAILHAFHMSYDLILQGVETDVIIPRLSDLLDRLHDGLATLVAQGSFFPDRQTNAADLDLYLSVAPSLLGGAAVSTTFSETAPLRDEMLEFVAAEDVVYHPIFSETCRIIDFSQFIPRGHYTESEILTRYFQAMMWLGRTEFYLIAPVTAVCEPTDADVQRQSVDAVMLQELVTVAQGRPLLDEINEIVGFFVGEPDNVTLDHLDRLVQSLGIASSAELLDEARWREFQDLLSQHEFATQRINSQILWSGDPTNPDGLKPASAFMLLGQRFVIDSYVTGHVVYDEVKAFRMLPSSLDVLFSLGNDAAGQLLVSEIEYWDYGRQLAALRYLIDAYDDSFWRETIYNGWLDGIRELNPPDDRTGLPAFMQTAAWWQQKMNTQLAGWAQLRHDNLLYAKQSYTGSIICEYPFSYVEPIPGFFDRMSLLATDAADRFSTFDLGGWPTDRIVPFFRNFAEVTDKLAGIARKELSGEMISPTEAQFLKQMIREAFTCGPQIDGWYTTLFFGGPNQSLEKDLVVADIHTAPTDAGGNYVGWVMHAGTGPLDMAVVTADLPAVGPVTFVGPVMSYYEHVSTDFLRLTDEAWQTAYSAVPSFRPDYVNLYMADSEGASRGEASVLVTGVEPDPALPDSPERAGILSGYPNPFTEATVLGFAVPSRSRSEAVEISIYDLHGRRLRTLLTGQLPAGNYTVEWDGRLADGSAAASGVYFCRLQTGSVTDTRVLTKLR